MASGVTGRHIQDRVTSRMWHFREETPKTPLRSVIWGEARTTVPSLRYGGCDLQKQPNPPGKMVPTSSWQPSQGPTSASWLLLPPLGMRRPRRHHLHPGELVCRTISCSSPLWRKNQKGPHSPPPQWRSGQVRGGLGSKSPELGHKGSPDRPHKRGQSSSPPGWRGGPRLRHRFPNQRQDKNEEGCQAPHPQTLPPPQ